MCTECLEKGIDKRYVRQSGLDKHLREVDHQFLQMRKKRKTAAKEQGDDIKAPELPQSSEDEAPTEAAPVLCYCKTAYNDHVFMVECDKCKECYHLACLEKYKGVQLFEVCIDILLYSSQIHIAMCRKKFAI